MNHSETFLTLLVDTDQLASVEASCSVSTLFFILMEERAVVEFLTRDRGLWVRASPEALHCVLEQDTLSSA